ncbi:MAG: YeiH family protein [Synechocystis sp.]|nr:YeiH family protein [Synechocystis sp.]
MANFNTRIKHLSQGVEHKLRQVLEVNFLIVLPGFLLSGLIACLSLIVYRQSFLHFLNPLLIAAISGIIIGNTVRIPRLYQPGIKFSMKRILRLSVILLGLKLSISEVLTLGGTGLIIIILSSISTFYLTCWLGQRFRINHKLTHLIAAGTSICGASAIIATNAVIDGTEEDNTYAIALITGLGTMAMVFYPMIPNLLHLSPQVFGLWCGASIHEVAQVVAAAFQHSAVSGELATISKLSRVLLIIPVITLLGYQQRKTRFGVDGLLSSVPWFVLAFMLMIVVNNLSLIPGTFKSSILSWNELLLCVSMAAMGLETKFKKLSRIGLTPLFLAISSWLFLSFISLSLIRFAAF